ncbi:MAG: N-acetylmuramoyl-L-alanine amidase CwlD [Deltaproteobacteria bacterium]
MIIVIRKKVLLSVSLFVVTACLVYSMSFQETVPTMVLPVTNKVIVLDPGHGGADPGAIGKSGTKEKDITLDIVMKLQGLLEQSGCITQLTRAVDESIHDRDSSRRKNSDLKNRKKIADTSQASAFISVHLNSFPQSRYKGVQSFYPKNSEQSKLLAVNIQKELKATLGINDNREALAIKDVYVLKNTNIPSVIVECGFLSNPEEEARLKSEKYRQKIAWGIYLGIMQFYNSFR